MLVQRSDATSLTIAAHEAGHAVAALLVGDAVTFATVVRTEDALGRVMIGPSLAELAKTDRIRDKRKRTWAQRRGIAAHAMAMLGGIAAERILRGADCQLEGYETDIEIADKYVRVLNWRNPSAAGNKAARERLLERTERLLRRPANWRSVEAIAGVLLRRGALKQAGIEQAIQQAARTKGETEFARLWAREQKAQEEMANYYLNMRANATLGRRFRRTRSLTTRAKGRFW